MVIWGEMYWERIPEAHGIRILILIDEINRPE